MAEVPHHIINDQEAIMVHASSIAHQQNGWSQALPRLKVGIEGL
jgi:hypothetical protein